MTRKAIIKLIQSGKFTLVYTDSDSCSIYKGKYDIDDDNDDEVEPVAVFEGNTDGYIPEIVDILVEALKGKAQSF